MPAVGVNFVCPGFRLRRALFWGSGVSIRDIVSICNAVLMALPKQRKKFIKIYQRVSAVPTKGAGGMELALTL